MKKFGGGAELPAFPQFMQGACYQLKANNFFDVDELIGAGFTGKFNWRVSPAEESFNRLAP